MDPQINNSAPMIELRNVVRLCFKTADKIRFLSEFAELTPAGGNNHLEG